MGVRQTTQFSFNQHFSWVFTTLKLIRIPSHGFGWVLPLAFAKQWACIVSPLRSAPIHLSVNYNSVFGVAFGGPPSFEIVG
jgi:hypothetical protein